jgi:hypothetical protein
LESAYTDAKNSEDVVGDAEEAEGRDDLLWLFMPMVPCFCQEVLAKYEGKEAFRIYGSNH